MSSRHREPSSPVKSRAKTESVLPTSKPDWDTWRKRGVVPLSHGILLAHNIRPHPKALANLKASGDSRTKQIESDCYTASLCMLNDPRLAPLGAPIGTNDAARQRQKVDLVKFANWAVEKIPHRAMPGEFQALAVPIAPSGNVASVPSQGTEASLDEEAWMETIKRIAARNRTSPSGATKKLQSVARLLVGVAVTHWKATFNERGLVPFNGLYTDLARTTSMDEDSIKEALELAVNLWGLDKARKFSDEAPSHSSLTSGTARSSPD